MRRKKIKNYQSLVFLSALIVVVLFCMLAKKAKAPDSSLDGTKSTLSATVTATTDLNQLVWPEGTTLSAKILMYHHIGPLPDGADDIRKGLTVSTENFTRQLKYLKDNNYTVTTLAKMYEMVAKGEKTDKVIVLSFDDGYSDNFIYAWPAMKEYNLTGTFFIISGKIGQDEYMGETQVKELVSAGNEIGSHSVSHLSMDKLSGQKLKNEINFSKETLEKMTGERVVSFCYPSGKFSEEVKFDLKEAGYKMAVTTAKGRNFSTDAPLEIPRYRINPTTNLETLLD